MMASTPCSKAGFLLFLLLQMSLPLCVMGQTTSQTPMATSSLTLQTNSTGTLVNANTTANATDPSSGSNTTSTLMLSCRLFTCNYSVCYNTFMYTNATLCPATASYCELRRENTMRYSVNCASTCSTFCNNTSQINCSVDCCGYETCLNLTISNLVTQSNMSMTSTSLPATTNTTKAPTIPTTTVATNGKKCQKLSCTGDNCYTTSNTNVVLCSTQNYCMLKKTTSGTVVSWTAGCSDDCSKETVCTSSTSTCFLECCNATTTASCLKLTGVVNMPNSATRGLFSPMLLMASSLYIWLMSMASSA